MSKISRNDLCPCGSGKKYKKCCALKEVERKKTFRSKTSFQPFSGKTASQSLAKKVFKVISTPSQGPQEESEKKCASLEELIGLNKKTPE